MRVCVDIAWCCWLQLCHELLQLHRSHQRLCRWQQQQQQQSAFAWTMRADFVRAVTLASCHNDCGQPPIPCNPGSGCGGSSSSWNSRNAHPYSAVVWSKAVVIWHCSSRGSLSRCHTKAASSSCHRAYTVSPLGFAYKSWAMRASRSRACTRADKALGQSNASSILRVCLGASVSVCPVHSCDGLTKLGKDFAQCGVALQLINSLMIIERWWHCVCCCIPAFGRSDCPTVSNWFYFSVVQWMLLYLLCVAAATLVAVEDLAATVCTVQNKVDVVRCEKSW